MFVLGCSQRYRYIPSCSDTMLPLSGKINKATRHWTIYSRDLSSICPSLCEPYSFSSHIHILCFPWHQQCGMIDTTLMTRGVCQWSMLQVQVTSGRRPAQHFALCDLRGLLDQPAPMLLADWHDGSLPELWETTYRPAVVLHCMLPLVLSIHHIMLLEVFQSSARKSLIFTSEHSINKLS